MAQNDYPTVIYFFSERWQSGLQSSTPIMLSSAAPIKHQSMRLHFSASACLEFTVARQGKGYYKSTKNRFAAVDDIHANPITREIMLMVGDDAETVVELQTRHRLAINGRGLKLLKLAYGQ